MSERISSQKLRRLADLADEARRSYRDARPALARRFEAAASAAAQLAESQERDALLETVRHELEQVKIEWGM